jgi:predicted DCC family thiol-disulfide oxidoreductase YuxK
MDASETFPELRGRKVIVFDGVCVLCSGFFQFVVKRDRGEAFHFVLAQSPLGEALYAHFGLKSADYTTNLVLIDGRLYTDLDTLPAVLNVIGGPWRLVNAIRLLPQSLRRFLYDRIARNRYALFGRRDICLVPAPELKARFLG